MADELPMGITAEQGVASAYVEGIITKGEESFPAQVTINFWNVGSLANDNYGVATMTIAEQGKCKFVCVNTTDQGVFSGGPNGSITFSGLLNGLHVELINRGYFQINDGTKIYQIPVDNPEIFSKYDWDLFNKEFKLKDSGAAFSGLTGQVEILVPGAKDWKLVKLDTIMPVGSHIRTQEDSTAILSFPDMSTFVLKEDSEVIITTPPEKESKLSLIAGNIWVNVKKMVYEGSMEIEMNQAVAGIKGTTFIAEENGNTSTLKLSREL